MKKLLFVVESLGGGGAEKVLLTLVKNLNKKKYNITVFTIVKTGLYVEELSRYCDIRYALDPDYKNNLQKFLYYVKYKLIYTLNTSLIYKYLIKEKYDIEIGFVEGFSTKFIASSNNILSKKVAWVHTDMLKNDYSDKLYCNLQQYIDTYKKFDKIMCVSYSVKDSFFNKFCLDSKVQYNPVDNDEILQLSTPSYVFDNEYINFITIGRLVEQKGYDRLLKIVKQLRGYKFKLFILGDGELRIQFEKYIKDNKLEEYVYLLGFQRNPYRYLASASAFICSSYAEGFSTVATEALILNIPIITTNCSGMKELFGQYNCGIICHNDETSLYESIKSVLDCPELLLQYKKEIVKRIDFFKLQKRMREIENEL